MKTLTKLIRFKKEFLLILLPLVLYLNSLGGDFVYDDHYLVVKNDWIQNTKKVMNIFSFKGRLDHNRPYRPVRELSYYTDHLIWKLNPAGYHLTNLIIHIANVLLLFLFLNMVFKNDFIAFISALLFAVHPVNTEAVSWISGRKELLLLMFMLITFFSFRFLEESDRKKKKNLFLFISIISFICAVFSKETGLIIPVFLLVINNRMKPLFRKIIIFLILSASAIFLFFLMIERGGIIKSDLLIIDWWENIKLIPAILFKYINLLFWPENLTVYYDIEVIRQKALIGTIFFVFISALLFFSFIRLKNSYRKELKYSLAFFLIPLLPVLGIVPIDNLIAERFLYIPVIGFSIFVAALIDFSLKIFKRKTIGILLIISLCFFYSARTVLRNNDWKNDFTLWESAKSIYDNHYVRWNLANSLREKGNTKKAEENYYRSISYNRNFWPSYFSLADLYRSENELEKALAFYQKTIKYNQKHAESHNNIGILKILQNNPRAAITSFNSAIAIDGLNADYYNNLATAYMQIDDEKNASIYYKKALKLYGDHNAAKRNISVINKGFLR